MNDAPENEREIFLQALELADPKERTRFLEKRCRENPELRERVEALLEANDVAATVLPTEPASLRDAETGQEGSLIGPYKLLQQVGEGGMGVVYMAEQQEPVIRRVALKIIKWGMDTRAVVARFEAERQALAIMDHPNIAKVLDAGSTESGRPYFVMELVHGVPIDAYCDKNQLEPRERLELFLSVCNAIQHAHLKGIIHRDLKPSNIMVTLHDGKPVPKVIDFGIAKATHQRLTEKTLFTQYGHMVGTPAYMSPEQAEMSGLDVDTRSDVYSLGVVLYKLLTGETPISSNELRDRGFGEMQRLILEQEPPKPSTRLSALEDQPRTIVAKNRKLDPAALSRLLQGDLDWIVMKALDKDRTRRYESASGLAADIRRHLNHEPVEAGAPGALFRLRKFVRRNRPIVAGLAAVFMTLLTGALVSSWLYLRAEEQRRAAIAARADAVKNAAEAQAAGTKLQAQLETTRKAREAESRARETTRGLLYASDMKLFREVWRAGDSRQAVKALERQQPAAGEDDLRGFEWRHYWKISHAQKATFRHETKARGQGRDFVLVALSPDGSRLATASANSVRLWDISSQSQLGEWPTPKESPVHAVQFDPSGERIQLIVHTPGEKRTPQERVKRMMRLLQGEADSSINQLLAQLEFRRSPVKGGEDWTNAKFDPGQMRGDGLKSFINTGAVRSDLLSHPVLHKGRIFNPACIAASPDRSLLLLGGISQSLPELNDPEAQPDFTKMMREQTGAILIWNVKQGRIAKLLEAHSSLVVSAAMSPDNRRVLSSSMDGEVILHDLQDGSARSLPDRQRGAPTWTQFDDEGSRLVVGHLGGVITIWSVEDLSLVRVLQTRATRYPAYAWRPGAEPESEGILATASADGLVEIWSDAAEQGPRETPLESTLLISATPLTDSRHHATVDIRGAYRVCDLSTGEWQEPRPFLNKDIETGRLGLSVALSASGASAVAETDGSIQVYSALPGAPPLALKAFKSQTRHLALSPNGSLLAAADPKTGEVHLWRVKTKTKLGVLPLQDRHSRNLAFSPDGRSLAHAGSLGIVRLFNVDTLTESRAWPGFDLGGNLMTFSPDGGRLLCAGTRDVMLWDSSTGEILFQKHTSADIQGIALHPDGTRIAIAQWSEGLPAELDLFDTKTGHEIVTLDQARDARFEHLAFTPDGARLTAWLSPMARANPFKLRTHLLKVWDSPKPPEN